LIKWISKIRSWTILTSILIDDDNSLAVEVPIWKPFENNINLLGHIDLIQFKNDIVYVIDYKLNENTFFTSLPQVGIYGLILKELLRIPKKKIKCISFDQNGA